MDVSKNGGPAFPAQEQIDYPSCSVTQHYPGMTLRDYFAAQALQGMCTGQWLDPGDYPEVARRCYAKADAMIAARGDA